MHTKYSYLEFEMKIFGSETSKNAAYIHQFEFTNSSKIKRGLLNGVYWN